MAFGNKRLIVYELNEVPLRVFNWFAQAYPKSNIAKLLRHGRVIETYTEDKGSLSPWITWPTLHRGVTSEHHAIYDFGQNLHAVNEDYPPLWDLLTRGGVKVGLFGSLHSYPLPADLDNYAFYVPDTFAAGPECFPSELGAFQEFNLSMVDRSGRNVTRGLPLRDAADFLAAAPGLGLRGATALKLAKQFATEQVKPHRVVRRRTSQMQIAFDFFLKALKSETPEVAFFFTNHVASSMHRFWPGIFPEDYGAPFWDEAWAATWGGEIPFAMTEADAQVRDLLAFVERDPRYSLVVASSMGQAAVTKITSLLRCQLNFTDLRQFMRMLEIPDDEWRRERAMIPIYMVTVAQGLAPVMTERLQQVRINGTPISFSHRGEGVFNIALGQPNLDDTTARITYQGRPVTLGQAGMANLDLQDEAGSNAYHIPQGSLIIYDPAQPAPASELVSVSTLEFAPAVLANFGLVRPSHMRAPDVLN